MKNTKSVSEFFRKDKPAFASYDNIRKFPCYIDGLKISQRKLLWTAFSEAVKFIKTETFCNLTALQTNYLHGSQNLIGVCDSLVQTWPGANNYGLFDGNSGGWGSRMIPVSAAGRYTRVKLAALAKELFNENDSKILDCQLFEGKYIEPKFLMPVFPVIFLNSSDGLSSGFRSKIYSRNPDEVIDYIKRKLNGTASPRLELKPWFKDFKGDVRFNDVLQSYESVGVITKNNMTSYTVTELPIGLDYSEFIELLEKLEEDKVIVSYEDKCDSTNDKDMVNFEIKTTREFTRKHEKPEQLLKVFKLVRSLSENLNCIDENGRVREFKNVSEVLDAYIDIRLKYLQKRKDFIVAALETETQKLSSKYLFCKSIIDKKLVVANVKKAEIVSQLEAMPDIKKMNGTYDFLLNMPIHSVSVETLASLKKELEQTEVEYKKVKATTIQQMWLDDIDKLKKTL